MKISESIIQPMGSGGGSTKPPPNINSNKKQIESADTVTLSKDALSTTLSGGGSTKPPPK